MTAHYPQATITGDVFLDEGPLDEVENPTPADVAAEFWANVGDWHSTGYQPVVEVVMAEGAAPITVDLEKEARA